MFNVFGERYYLYRSAVPTMIESTVKHSQLVCASSMVHKDILKMRLQYPFILRGGKYITIGDKTGIGVRGFVLAWDVYMKDAFTPEIKIGNNIWIGEDCHITAINKIEIGINVLMGKKVTISDNSHGNTDSESLLLPPKERPLFSKDPVLIDDNVWIGDKVTILPGVRIGKNAIIGANSVVTNDVAENCVVGGNPAHIIKRMNLE